MTTFDKREEGFEKKFAIDEEQKFKAGARRNKLLGLWAADRLGITGDAAAAYAKEVISAEFDGTGDTGVIRKVMRDFGAKSVVPTTSTNASASRPGRTSSGPSPRSRRGSRGPHAPNRARGRLALRLGRVAGLDPPAPRPPNVVV